MISSSPHLGEFISAKKLQQSSVELTVNNTPVCAELYVQTTKLP